MAADLIILGTDTDAGKTTFALLWLAAFGEDYAYWKPVETGPSDTAAVRALLPKVVVPEPAQRFADPVAPPLAARRQHRAVSTAERLAAARPSVPGKLLIESFGSPFSPLNDDELQLEFLRRLSGDRVLVSSSALGTIGRTLQSLEALTGHGLGPVMVVLVGEHDAYAEATLRQHSRGVPVFSLKPPQTWTTEGLHRAAAAQRATMNAMRASLPSPPLPGRGGEGASGPGEPLVHLAKPQTVKLLQRDRQCVWHPYTSLREAAPPLPVVAAEDEFLILADGRRIIDGISSWWTILHGHRQPALMQALADASRQIDHVLFAGATHPWGVELAELLLQSMPWTGGRVFYSDNGSTAVEVALKMAYQYWQHWGERQRTRFIGFHHGYHGDTFGAMAVSRDPLFFGRFEPLLCRADILPLDPDALDEHLRRSANQTAAVILEPLVQGAGGMRMHSPETLRQVFELTRKHHVLFIADEVMTGGGRTGTLWAHQAAGIAPDLICAAKTLAGGILSLAATLAAPHIVAAFDTDERSQTFFHGHSFTAHPLACAVALANWKLLTAGLLTRPREMEGFWSSSLAGTRARINVKEVRIRGSIAAIELDVPGGYLAEAGQRMRETCLEHGVLLRPLGNVLYALPPYCVSPASLERIARAMKAAIS